MKTNEIFASAEIEDQVSFEDCIVRKIDPHRRKEGSKDKDGYFRITPKHKEDLMELGFDTSHISDEQMAGLVIRMADEYSRRFYWQSLENVANEMDLPKLAFKKMSL